MKVTGRLGELRCGYHVAAVLGAWVMDSAEDGRLVLTAAVELPHGFWATQRPLGLALRLSGGSWTWQAVEVPDVLGDTVVIAVKDTPAVGRWQERAYQFEGGEPS